MLKITTDGRKLALDQRLINDMLPDTANNKVSACAERCFKVWQETKEQKSAQLVFCDTSTPKKDGSFNVYDKVGKYYHYDQYYTLYDEEENELDKVSFVTIYQKAEEYMEDDTFVRTYWNCLYVE